MNDPPDAVEVRLAEIAATLSMAADLSTGHPIERSLRACLLAVSFGATLGLAEDELHDLYYVALLRWVGCTLGLDHTDLLGDGIVPGEPIDQTAPWKATRQPEASGQATEPAAQEHPQGSCGSGTGEDRFDHLGDEVKWRPRAC